MNAAFCNSFIVNLMVQMHKKMLYHIQIYRNDLCTVSKSIKYMNTQSQTYVCIFVSRISLLILSFRSQVEYSGSQSVKKYIHMKKFFR